MSDGTDRCLPNEVDHPTKHGYEPPYVCGACGMLFDGDMNELGVYATEVGL